MSDWNNKTGITDPNSDINNINQFQDIKLKLVTPAPNHILSKAEAKNYLKASSDTTDDDLIDQLISAAVGIIERELGGVCLYQQQWTQYQQGGCNTIELLREPLIGTPTVSYYEDFDSTATSLTASSVRSVENELFHVDGYFERGREGDGYHITFDAGLFTASNYTSSDDPRLNVFKTAIGRTVAWLYDQREEHVTSINEGNWSVTYDNNLPVGIKRLIMPFHSGKSLI